MKKIGMIVAVFREIEAVLNKYEGSLEKLDYKAFDVYKFTDEKSELYILHSGMGQIAAASGAQFLISTFGVDLIINYGVVGGLTEEMTLSKTCIVESVVHYDFDTSLIDNCEVGRYCNLPSLYLPATAELIELATSVHPELKRVVCASGDKFVENRKRKEELNKDFNADICEMEAAGIVLTSNRNDVPCILIKTVSDSITGGAEEFSREVRRAAVICLEIVNKIIEKIII